MSIFLRQSSLSLLVASIVGLSTVAVAADSQAEQRVREEVQSALLRLVDNGEIAADDLATLRLDVPASRTPVFGAIIDARFRPESDRSGLPVAAVTPNSSASQIGLRAGDRLLAANGASLLGLGADTQGRSIAIRQLKEALESSAAAIALRVDRGGDILELTGPVRIVDLPAYRLELGHALAGATYAAGAGGGDGLSSCGRVSVFDAAPRGKQIYRAVLIAIDGELPGPPNSDTYRLDAGRHRLTVAEAIDPEQFNSVQRTQRDRQGRERYKELTIDVQPGITYRLGAHFILDQRNSIRDNAYWEPVIWAEAAETCR